MNSSHTYNIAPKEGNRQHEDAGRIAPNRKDHHRWVGNLSCSDYRNDILIGAGDVTDSLRLLDWCLRTLAARFRRVLFVPRNHDLWVLREKRSGDSFDKYERVRAIVESSDASMDSFRYRDRSIVPLLGCYHYSFGAPTDALTVGGWTSVHVDGPVGSKLPGTTGLEAALRSFKPAIHVYCHSHVNQDLTLGGIRYVNNAFGYPTETAISAKRLLCIHEC